MKNRRLIREFTPPLLYRTLAALSPRSISFSGPYQSWAAALDDSDGYDSAHIVEKVTASARKVKAGEAAFERDSVLFEDVCYQMPMLAGLMRAALECDGRLSVLDFGGSLGSSYYQNRKFLEVVKSLQWHIVEQGKYVDEGNYFFADGKLKFFDSIEASVSCARPNAILLSSVLQYMEAPYALLEELLTIGAAYLIIDRTPFSISGGESIMVQKVPAKIYKASYPTRVFDYDKLTTMLGARYSLVSEIDCAEDVVGLGRKAIHFRGGIFRLSGDEPRHGSTNMGNEHNASGGNR